MVEGMYITWSNTANSKTGDKTSAMMAVNVDLHLYNNSVDSIVAFIANGATPAKTAYFVWEI